MNRMNQALMGPLLGIALVYAALSFVYTILNLNDGNFTVAIDPLGLFEESIIPVALHDAYWELIALYTNLAGDMNLEYVTMALFTIGFVLVVAGVASKPTRDLRGSDDDPQQYLFTHQPKAFMRCLLIPWNIMVAAWRKKKIPVILPIIFIPFMLPFALLMDVILVVIFVIEWAIMSIRIRLVSSKDKEEYDTETQYAVCPKCKRQFYQPNIKCKCGLMISYPVPNRHGVKFHYCNNGHKIPSTNADGARAKLDASCPFCTSDMTTHEAKPLVISLVGSVGSGKTTLMLSSVEEISMSAKEKGIVSEVITDGISPEKQRRRSNVIPTVAGELDSEYFFLRARDLPEKQVMINDISGLEFQPDSDKILFEEYYRYNDGIILTVDPLEIMALHHSQSPTKGSKDTPVATLESFYHMYTEINGYGPAVKSTVPFAVVLTKMDNPKVKASIEAEGSAQQFLEAYGHKMMVDIIQSAFRNVRYFTVASLGDDSNAAEPFGWILSEGDKDLKIRLF